jgi:hypothetical protein
MMLPKFSQLFKRAPCYIYPTDKHIGYAYLKQNAWCYGSAEITPEKNLENIVRWFPVSLRRKNIHVILNPEKYKLINIRGVALTKNKKKNKEALFLSLAESGYDDFALETHQVNVLKGQEIKLSLKGDYQLVISEQSDLRFIDQCFSKERIAIRSVFPWVEPLGSALAGLIQGAVTGFVSWGAAVSELYLFENSRFIKKLTLPPLIQGCEAIEPEAVEDFSLALSQVTESFNEKEKMACVGFLCPEPNTKTVTTIFNQVKLNCLVIKLQSFKRESSISDELLLPLLGWRNE